MHRDPKHDLYGYEVVDVKKDPNRLPFLLFYGNLVHLEFDPKYREGSSRDIYGIHYKKMQTID
jgi:hypothetical protein